VRKIIRGEDLPSGRVRIDLDAILDGIAQPVYGSSIGGAVADEPPAEPAAADLHTLFDTLGTRDAVLFAGSRAPSLGNAQPWRFETDDAGVTVRPDPARSPRTDVLGRASAVGLGAVLHNMTVAASARGVFGKAEIAGSGSDVRVRIVYGDSEVPDVAGQLAAMLDRRTDRGFGDRSELSAEVPAALLADVVDGVQVRLITDPSTIARVAGIAGAAERIRYLTPALHAEMVAEVVAPSNTHSDTGIDLDDLGLLPQQAPLMALLRRPDVMALLEAWDAGSALGADAQGRLMSASALAVVSNRGRDTADYVLGGQAMESLWIHAQTLGLAVHPVSPVFVYADGRAELDQVAPGRADELAQLSTQFDEALGIGHGEAVTTVLRLSRTGSVRPASRRRSVANLLG
jgi:hypothetical protein